MSNFGVIHAHDPRAAAAELARVVRPGGTVAVTAWAPSGLMGQVLQLGARGEGAAASSRPQRWGRYETATLHFAEYESFEMTDATLSIEVATREAAWTLFAQPPGPLAAALGGGADPQALRAEVDALVAGYVVERPDGPLTLEVAYSVIAGRAAAE